MKKKSASQSAFFNLRLLTGLFLALAGIFQFGNPGAAFSGNYTVEGGACAWSAGPDMPSVGVRSVGVYFPDNGKFYAMGGRSSDAAGSDFMHPFEYDPATNTWTTKSATYPDNQVNNMACAVLGGVMLPPLIYCVGGSAAGQTTATARVFYYDPVADTITALTGADNWPGDSSGTILPGGSSALFTDGLALNSTLFILGGFDINVASTNQIWEFNPRGAVGSKWTQRVNTPMGVMYAPTCNIDGTIYVGGASDYQGGAVVDTTNSFSFTPAGNIIGSIAAIPRATGETRALSFNGKMLVMGGGRIPPNPSNEVDIYDPGSNTWTVGSPVPSFVTARRNFPTDTDGARHIWLAGGYASDGVTPLASMGSFECSVVGGLTLGSAASVERGFAIDLPLTGSSGVEDRSGGPNKKFYVAMTFNNNITSLGSATTTCGGVSTWYISGPTVTIKLVGVAHGCNESDITVTANDVMDDMGNTLSSASVAVGLLLGDVNGDRVVDGTDFSIARSYRGQRTDGTNYRSDVSNDGYISASDLQLIQQQQGTSLP
jgi:hypothetical protein